MLLRRGIGDPGDQFPCGRGKGDGIEFGLPGPQLHREPGFIASYPQLNFLILLLCGNVAKIMVAKSGFVAPGHYGYQAEAVAEMIEITRQRRRAAVATGIRTDTQQDGKGQRVFPGHQ